MFQKIKTFLNSICAFVLLLKRYGKKRDTALSDSKNEKAVTFTVEGRTYSVLAYLTENEQPVEVEELVRRAVDLGANLGKSDFHHLYEDRVQIPEHLREFTFFFTDFSGEEPGTDFLDEDDEDIGSATERFGPCKYIWCLRWRDNKYGGCWVEDYVYYTQKVGNLGRLLRRLN